MSKSFRSLTDRAAREVCNRHRKHETPEEASKRKKLWKKANRHWRHQ